MELELYIENLGAIEKAEFTVNPLTVLAGQNGTGKSFVTKFLYSVLKVLNQDVYKIELFKKFNQFLQNSNILQEFIISSQNSAVLHSIAFINEKKMDLINAENLVYYSDLSYIKNSLNSLLPMFNEEIDEHIRKLTKNEKNVTNNSEINISFNIKKTNALRLLEDNKLILNTIYKMLDKPEYTYFGIVKEFLITELKENFQISTIEQLIRHSEDKLIFEIKDKVSIYIEKNEIIISQMSYNIGKVLNLNRLVFFESPIYWRLSASFLKGLVSDRNFFYLAGNIKDERLTGIPQHFLDLRELVFANFKHGERPAFIEECADELQSYLNGKFSSNGNDLAFETNQGQAIAKNLVSFGMTNLGVIQAVLSKNIINKGSFVFIDEPESNLHPEWQAILAKILVKLAENGVFVVITTHSSDMLKALDVYTSSLEQQNFVSTQYFEKDGHLASFDEEEINNVGKIALVRNKLLEPYASLTFAKKGGFFDD
ncbi:MULTISPECIES: AAA family ATPase [unclassified Moraxella]|uniref:AAA family ATPase n=1 Tax=unclassified Moraxella TaxID=2685852 RepID=UPI003AF6BD7A